MPSRAFASHRTHDRLLDAAGEVFAQCGYREATIRSICRRARANVASVNYYFGDKARLYLEVLKFGARKVLERFPIDGGLQGVPEAEEELRAFVRAMISRFLDPAGRDWYARLCMRELVEPTAAMDSLVQDVVRPLIERLERIVRRVAGAGIEDETIHLCTRSVLGQCLFYHHSRAVIERIYGKALYDGGSIARVSEHITSFSIAGLQQITRRHSKEPGHARRSLRG